MASDIPEAGFRDSILMARALVTYMTDDRAIARAIRAEFPTGVGLPTIRKLRAAHRKSLRRPPEKPFKAYEGYRPEEMAERMEAASKVFLYRIERERVRSVDLARSLGALHSPLLTRPDLVSKAYDREAERARSQNTELQRLWEPGV